MKRKTKVERDVRAYWRARAALRLLKRDANALAGVAVGIYDLLRKNPPSELVVVHALPHPELALQGPTTLSLAPIRGRRWQAVLPELAIAGAGETEESAVRAVVKTLTSGYLTLERDPSADPERWQLFQQLVRRLPLADSAPTGAPSPAVVLEPGTLPTFEDWLERNAPRTSHTLYMAWKNGANTRLHGKSECQYRGLRYIKAWREGFSAMDRYLKAGGVMACPSCLRPLPMKSSTGGTAPSGASLLRQDDDLVGLVEREQP